MAQFQILKPGKDGQLYAEDGYFDDGLTARPGDPDWSTKAVERHVKRLGGAAVCSYVCTPNWTPRIGSAEDVAVLADLALWQMAAPAAFSLFQRHAQVRAEFDALAKVADTPTKAKLQTILAARLADLTPGG